MSERRAKRTYTNEFKKQIVNLYNNGKKSSEIIKEYDLTPSTFHKWIRYYNNSGSFKEEDNRTEDEKRLIELEKRNRQDVKLESEIIRIFKESKNNYGTRKIKVELSKLGYQVSRRKIGIIMKLHGLVSNYTVKQYKVHKAKCNEGKIENIVNREFDRDDILDVVVSDLTYVTGKWNYVCLILDLFNRKIIGYASAKHKDANLVYKAICKIPYDLSKINIFHTDRGNEFKNKLIDDVIGTFGIQRSLSKKGCPYDNAVAEATYKIFKTEFAYNRRFDNFEELENEVFDYVNWYNNIRIHGSLDYQTPVQYRLQYSL